MHLPVKYVILGFCPSGYTRNGSVLLVYFHSAQVNNFLSIFLRPSMDQETVSKTTFVFRTTNQSLLMKLLEIQKDLLDPLAQTHPEYFDLQNSEKLKSELLKLKPLQNFTGTDTQHYYPVVGGTFPINNNTDLSGKTVKMILTNYEEYVHLYAYLSTCFE